ncbi:iron-containing alcohol dehydrogenase [Chlorobium ferrooxidans]|uniref:Iron-containing alcohol dehydrogenase n=1 Tax=Chlorobium ferrooxidans DSM 13031 TaxID=377431 RepID=Q0YSZ4_9CHLB|nr:iron-containing alcohol dehydrogenase [Chlorobium ferrooxidans]EAT59470.1 Iron-containing alcohol dehydrogenase [Chlorobium ferrooxidans DSM 13031]
MNFFLSTDLVIGVNEALNLNEHLAALAVQKPGIIYDANLAGNLYFQDVLKNLTTGYKNSVLYCNEFGGEPTYAHLENVAEFFRGNVPDGIIAIGGGSTLDLGKGVALLLTNQVPALSLKGFPKGVNDPLPLVTVPSLLGSGAEVSFNAVFIDEAEGRKLGINSRKNFPKKAVIDPALSMTAPMESVIASAMDSLVHCVDSFGSVKHTALSRIFSVEGFQRTFYALQQGQLDRAESRLDLAIGSVCGTVALMNSGDGPTNGFAYYLGVRNKVPHGLAGAIFLKEVMRYNHNHGYEKYALLNPMRSSPSPSEATAELLEEMDELYRQLSIPTLVPYGYGKSNAADFAHHASEALKGSFSGNPVEFTEESARSVVFQLT